MIHIGRGRGASVIDEVAVGNRRVVAEERVVTVAAEHLSGNTLARAVLLGQSGLVALEESGVGIAVENSKVS